MAPGFVARDDGGAPVFPIRIFVQIGFGMWNRFFTESGMGNDPGNGRFGAGGVAQQVRI